MLEQDKEDDKGHDSGDKATGDLSSQTENSILYRASRLFQGRYCIVTIYNYIPGKAIEGFSGHWPYAAVHDKEESKQPGLSTYYRILLNGNVYV